MEDIPSFPLSNFSVEVFLTLIACVYLFCVALLLLLVDADNDVLLYLCSRVLCRLETFTFFLLPPESLFKSADIFDYVVTCQRCLHSKWPGFKTSLLSHKISNGFLYEASHFSPTIKVKAIWESSNPLDNFGASWAVLKVQSIPWHRTRLTSLLSLFFWCFSWEPASADVRRTLFFSDLSSPRQQTSPRLKLQGKCYISHLGIL